MTASELLEQRERQLGLIMALDRARDAVDVAKDPEVMFRAITDLMREHFQAEASALLLFGDDGTQVETVVHTGMDYQVAQTLCEAAVGHFQPDYISNEVWRHTLGLCVVQDSNDLSLGTLVLARNDRPFTRQDAELLEIAESQIDSAIVQARNIWELANRNRQLEAIFAIDHLRDDREDEADLIAGFTTILTEYFEAELVMVILSHIDSGELIIRGIMDKENLPLSAVDSIRKMTEDIMKPQQIDTPPGIEQVNLLAAPLIVSGVNLGSVVVGRKLPYMASDHRLLYAMMSQMDSAIAHSRTDLQLDQRNQELETIYRIDRIRDSDIDFDSMMVDVLNELCQAVNSEIGYLMLYSEDEERRLEIKATTYEGVLTSPAYNDAINALSVQALEQGEAVYSNQSDGAVRSIVAIPLILNDKVIGVFGTLNSSNPRGFSAEDRRMLMAITSQVDTAVFERLERRQMRKVLSRSVDPKVLEHMLQRADENILTGERVVLSVLFADLRGSTEWTERTEPEELVSTLNAFLGRMTGVIFKNGGTLDKFVGDEVIALFGTPVQMDNHVNRAAACALDMQQAHQRLINELAEQGIELPPMGVGIATGEVIAGEFGPPIRTDFTAMGRAMNLGARLCSAAPAGEILISEATRQVLAERCEAEPMATIDLKGIGEVQAYRLLSFK